MFKWVVGAFLGALLVLGVWLAAGRGDHDSPIGNTSTAARMIRTAIQQWQAANHQLACPPIAVLISDKQLDPEQPATDPWQHPFRLQCTADEITVSSAGPDGVFDTADDIVVPHAAQRGVK